jgi:hypothetical protein
MIASAEVHEFGKRWTVKLLEAFHRVDGQATAQGDGTQNAETGRTHPEQERTPGEQGVEFRFRLWPLLAPL